MNKEKAKKYPEDWQLISAKIRFERAKCMCENCGLSNGMIIERFERGKFRIIGSKELEEITATVISKKSSLKAELKYRGLTKIILTVAHLNHDEKDNRDENLKALCQRCHLMYDKFNNKTRYRNKSGRVALDFLPLIGFIQQSPG